MTPAQCDQAAAFLMAALLEMVVFAMVDPADIQWRGQPLEVSRQAVYTMAFFFFWAVTMASSFLTTTLAMSPFEVNRCPVPPDQRPADCAKEPGDPGCQGGGCGHRLPR